MEKKQVLRTQTWHFCIYRLVVRTYFMGISKCTSLYLAFVSSVGLSQVCRQAGHPFLTPAKMLFGPAGFLEEPFFLGLPSGLQTELSECLYAPAQVPTNTEPNSDTKPNRRNWQGKGATEVHLASTDRRYGNPRLLFPVFCPIFRGSSGALSPKASVAKKDKAL